MRRLVDTPTTGKHTKIALLSSSWPPVAHPGQHFHTRPVQLHPPHKTIVPIPRPHLQLAILVVAASAVQQGDIRALALRGGPGVARTHGLCTRDDACSVRLLLRDLQARGRAHRWAGCEWVGWGLGRGDGLVVQLIWLQCRAQWRRMARLHPCYAAPCQQARTPIGQQACTTAAPYCTRDTIPHCHTATLPAGTSWTAWPAGA